MYRHLLIIFATLFTCIFLPGCSHQIIIPEVLQQPLDGKIYTKCNLWYRNPDQINSLNFQTGRFLPVGTEVIPIRATKYQVVFKTLDGQQFTILFDPQMMLMPMRAYINQIFTLKTRETYFEGMSKAAIKSILSGVVKRGMTKKQVLLTCGTPSVCRTPSTRNSTWIYFFDRNHTFRVVFRGNKVKAIVNINDEESL